MKTRAPKIVAAAAMLAAIAFPQLTAHAQLLGQVSTARTLERGTNDIGGYLGVFEDATTVFGQYRRGLSNSLDFGVQAGILDPDARGADAALIIGGDLKWMVMAYGADPFDMALDGRVSFYEIANVTVFSIGGTVLLSRDYRLSQGSYLSPYGGVNIRLDRASSDIDHDNASMHGFRAAAQDHIDDSDTELNIGGVAGVKWELSDLIDALGEFVLDDQWGIVLGLNFKL